MQEDNPPLSVLFVCTGNICRSAFADRLSRHLLGEDTSVRVASAGTHGWVGSPVEDLMAAQLTARGVDPDGFTSRRLTMPMVDEADLVLTAAVRHRQFILDDRPAAVWRVFTLGQFARVLRVVPPDLQGADLLATLRAAHQPAAPEDDVGDPYGRGPDAAASAAQHLEELLHQIIPRLAAAGAD